jgi:hypothetical protein
MRVTGTQPSSSGLAGGWWPRAMGSRRAGSGDATSGPWTGSADGFLKRPCGAVPTSASCSPRSRRRDLLRRCSAGLGGARPTGLHPLLPPQGRLETLRHEHVPRGQGYLLDLAQPPRTGGARMGLAPGSSPRGRPAGRSARPALCPEAPPRAAASLAHPRSADVRYLSRRRYRLPGLKGEAVPSGAHASLAPRASRLATRERTLSRISGNPAG